jgi:hypothetical protein
MLRVAGAAAFRTARQHVTKRRVASSIRWTDGAPAPPGFKNDAQIVLVVTAGERYLVSFPAREGDAALEDALAAVGAVEGATVVLIESDRPGYAVARVLGPGDATQAAIAIAVVNTPGLETRRRRTGDTTVSQPTGL